MTGIIQISAADTRELVESHNETEYVLIDVRENEEYQSGHIPGALHIPLMQVLTSPNEIETAPYTIFYCRSGRRSLHAGMAVSATGSDHKMYNLEGGILSWRGEQLVDLPNLRAFDTSVGLRGLLEQAMDLEKGAHRFYSSFAAVVDTEPLASVIGGLIEAEENHAQLVYDLMSKLEGSDLPPFDQVFEKLEGNLLESADSYDEIMVKARAAHAQNGNKGLLEISLEMELKAFDLYRTIANKTQEPDVRDAFIDLAEQEKRHAMALVRGLASIAG